MESTYGYSWCQFKDHYEHSKCPIRDQSPTKHCTLKIRHYPTSSPKFKLISHKCFPGWPNSLHNYVGLKILKYWSLFLEKISKLSKSEGSVAIKKRKKEDPPKSTSTPTPTSEWSNWSKQECLRNGIGTEVRLCITIKNPRISDECQGDEIRRVTNCKIPK